MDKSNFRAVASSTRSPSGVTSFPIPSPAITAMRLCVIPNFLKKLT